jgi:hypothetical protein
MIRALAHPSQKLKAEPAGSITGVWGVKPERNGNSDAVAAAPRRMLGSIP